MNNRFFLFTASLAIACLLAFYPQPAAAFIIYTPPTLGNLCRQSTHIYVLRVERVEKAGPEKGSIIFKYGEQLKAQGVVVPDGMLAKHVFASDVNVAKPLGPNGAKVILDWAAEGKTAVLFALAPNQPKKKPGEPAPEIEQSLRGPAHVYIDGYWYLATCDPGNSKVWVALHGEPIMLTRYCGAADNLGAAVAKILRGEEIMVPAMVGDNKQDLEARRAKVQDLRASLKILNYDEKGNPVGESSYPGGKVTPIPGRLPSGKPVPEPTFWKPESGDKKPEKKHEPGDKKPVDTGGKPASDGKEKQPDEPKKPKEPAKPARDPAPTAAVIDAEVDRRLTTDKIPASPQADDAEFLRRVTLDLTGRIPTYQQTVAFLDSKDPGKRRKLIDELLDSSAYGEHFAGVWRGRLIPRELNLTGKGGGQRDTFSPWLAEQFNDNRGWNALVTDLLTAEGTPADNPATAFLIANGVSAQSQPGKVAGAVTGLFLSINLRCAECHHHPFVNWKQKDFWGTAAFFGKTQYGGAKGGRPSLTESLASSGGGSTKEKGQSGPMLRGTAIVIPSTSGKAAGQLVKARFLGGAEPELDEKEPFRPKFAAWATAADNPYFARAAVNRMWAHFFGRGFVNPLDEFDESNPPSHPELLDRLTSEFTASGFDLKHLARCIANSKAYQRSSRPVPGNEADVADFSHMAVKVLTPEVLCDVLSIIVKGGVEKQEIRDQFVRSFRVDEESAPTEYIQGIPQMLRLMNAPTRGGSSSKEKGASDRGAPLVENLYSSKASHTEAIATLYLTVLSRRPTTNEVELMSGYLSRRKNDQEGYRGVLWILLNSSEFALNR